LALFLEPMTVNLTVRIVEMHLQRVKQKNSESHIGHCRDMDFVGL